MEQEIVEREAALARMRHEEASLQSDDGGLRRLEQQLEQEQEQEQKQERKQKQQQQEQKQLPHGQTCPRKQKRRHREQS